MLKQLFSLKQLVLFIALFVTVFVTTRSVFQPEFFRVHDYIHGARIAEMSRALLEGHFPVRWTENFGYGYGMPLFEFYAPLPYYFGSIIHLFTQKLIWAVKSLWIVPSVLSFIGAFLIGRKLFGFYGGIVAAILFTLAPYRAVNLFVRGAIGEVWAVAFFPMILYGIFQILEKQKHAWKILLGSLVGLILSHNLMTLMFFPFAIGFAIMGWIGNYHHYSNKDRRQKVGELAGTFALAAGLTTFYTIPALVEKGYTQVESRILGGYFHYSQHFLYIRQFFQENWQYGGSQWGPEDDISFFLGHIQLILLVFASGVFLLQFAKVLQHGIIAQKSHSFFRRCIRVWQKQITARHLFIFSLFPAFTLSTYMTLQRSEVFWNVLTPLQVAQFPWRFLSLSILFIALIGGWSFALVHRNSLRALLTLSLLLIASLLSWRYFVPEYYLDSAQELYYGDADRIEREMSGILPDYIPLNVSSELSPRGQLQANVKRGEAEVLQVIDKTHLNVYQIEVTEVSTIEVPIAWFPGWKVRVDGVVIPSQESAQGLIEFSLAPGSYRVEVVFTNSPIRAIADTISVIAGFIVVTLLLLERKRTKK